MANFPLSFSSLCSLCLCVSQSKSFEKQEENRKKSSQTKTQRHKENNMTENQIASQVVDAAFKIHSECGPGLLESAYEVMLKTELAKRNLHVQTQVPISMQYEGETIEHAFTADMIVEEIVIVELKATETMHPVFSRQLHTYLKITGMKLGLLINFGMPRIKEGIERIINGQLT